MTENRKHSLVAADLPLTLYLNRQLTSDLLAALSDGFSSSSIVQTATSEGAGANISGGAQIGIKGLANFEVGGQDSQQDEKSKSITEHIQQTPTSLFARLRKELRNHNIVRSVSDDIRPGDFVEFESTLHKSSAVEMLMAMSEVLPIIEVFQRQQLQQNRQNYKSGSQKKGGNNQNRKESQLKKEMEDMSTFISTFLSAVTDGESQDLVAKANEYHVVLTTGRQYFVDPTMNDVIDGMFNVFGKVTRVISAGSSERINLLRKSPLGRLQNLLPQLKEAVAPFEDLAGSKEVATVDISGPAIQVIPIAIFV